MALLSEIKAQDWSLSINSPGEVVEGLADISQCMFIILTTKKRSDPLRPLFGCDAFEFVDKPANIAIPNIKASIVEAIKIWEPRAKVISVTHIITDAAFTFKIFSVTEAGLNIPATNIIYNRGN